MPLRHRLPLATATAVLLAVPVGAADARSASVDIPLEAMQGHLAALQQIADDHGGSRGTGDSGYQASVDYVKGKLEGAGYDVTVQSFSTWSGESYNVIAEMAGTDPDSTVMFGGHLDSANNPGMNDNGSGVAGVLQSALSYAASGEKPRNTVRFAFWGAEELGLIGSKHYVNSLSSTQRGQIEAYVNVDMIGSKNVAYMVYDDNPRGDFIRDDLTNFFTAEGIDSDLTDPDGRSDHAAFIQAGIPTGGLFSGAEQRKTTAQAQKWGGTSGVAYDSCYHRACDDIDNVDTTSLDHHADVLGQAVWAYTAKDFGATQR